MYLITNAATYIIFHFPQYITLTLTYRTWKLFIMAIFDRDRYIWHQQHRGNIAIYTMHAVSVKNSVYCDLNTTHIMCSYVGSCSTCGCSMTSVVFSVENVNNCCPSSTWWYVVSVYLSSAKVNVNQRSSKKGTTIGRRACLFLHSNCIFICLYEYNEKRL